MPTAHPTTAADLKPGALYRLIRDSRSPEGEAVRHDLLVAHRGFKGTFYFDDTFGGRAKAVTWQHLKGLGCLEFVLDLTGAREVSSDAFALFEAADKAYIPEGAKPERFLVRAGAALSPRLRDLRGHIAMDRLIDEAMATS